MLRGILGAVPSTVVAKLAFMFVFFVGALPCHSMANAFTKTGEMGIGCVLSWLCLCEQG